MKVRIKWSRPAVRLLRFDSRTSSLPACLLFIGLLLVGIGHSTDSNAQQKPTSTPIASVPDDRAPVRVRYPAPEHLRELQTSRDYQYNHDAPPPENPVARFFAWLYRWITEFLNSNAYQSFWQYVILAVIAGLVIYLLAKAEVLGFLFPKKTSVSALDYENLTEDIYAIDFDAAVDEAVRQRNYRLAVRLLYLQTLKHLASEGLITYKLDKTNREYIYELVNLSLRADFEYLTRQFEFVWYGNFSVDERQFGHLNDQFRAFNRIIYSSQVQPVNR